MGIMTGRKAAYLGGVALFALGIGLTPFQAEAAAAEEEAKPVPVSAPKAMPKPVQDEDELLDEEDDEVEEIITTGSRLRRSEFNVASPIQIIGGEASRELGAFDSGELLQRSNQASGFQINNTFSGFVLDNGFGSQTVALRGLGPERTLVMINGRRLVSAGNGGAPGVADLSLVPNIAIGQFETLFDGASTIYGSDAVAGVTNIILRDDVDGFEVEVAGSLNESGGGEEYQVGVLWGDTGDNYSVTVAAEYRKVARQSRIQNPFMNECNEVINETPTGEILNINEGLFTSFPGGTPTACGLSAHNRLIEGTGFFGSVYFDPNGSNINLGNFSETNTGFEVFARDDISFFPFRGQSIPDGNGDGATDLDFGTALYNFQLSEAFRNADFTPETTRMNIFTTGSYNLGDDNNTELYAELSFARRETSSRSTPAQYFPVAPASNPFNPFGVNGISPVEAFFAPGVISAFGLSTAPTTAQGVWRIAGDRDNVENSIDQYRAFVGVRGGIGFMDDFLEGNWEYDATFGYQRSEGFETRTGISEERGQNSLDFTTLDANGNASCTTPDGATCLPINFFAPRFFTVEPVELTQEERDYLLVNRDVATEIEMTTFNFFLQGDVLELPWNNTTVPLFIGYEFREDSISTTPNDVTLNGEIFGFFRDLGSNGSRNFHEVFGETSFTLLQGVPGADLLQIDASARYTKEEFSDSEFTYSFKGFYRPVEFLTLRGTYGTSFRAPNLRERFIGGLTGFTAVGDPCIVPELARDDAGGPNSAQTYVASEDGRDQRILDSCRANGVDPTSLGLRDPNNPAAFNAGAPQSTEVATVGSNVPQAENSTAWTVGVILEQTFTDAFDLTLSATYYDIEITGGVAELGSGAVIGNCYNNEQFPNGGSEFCQFIQRDDNNFLDFVGLPFINAGIETSKGVDFNAQYRQEFEVGEETMIVNLNLQATYLSERSFEILDAADDNAGEQLFPHWRASAQANIDYSDFRLNWQTRWIQGGQPDTLDTFDTGSAGCAGSDIVCRSVDVTQNYNVHDASLSYNMGEYRFTFGVRNVFNQGPSLVSGGNGALAINNLPLGVGYDVFGRRFFLNAQLRF